MRLGRGPAAGLRSDPAGYAIVLAGYLLMAATAPLVAFTHAPPGAMLSLRMAIAAVPLDALFVLPLAPGSSPIPAIASPRATSSPSP